MPSPVCSKPHPAAQEPAKDQRRDGNQYSAKYYDDVYEYRHVVVPKETIARVPKNKLLTEDEWRALGVKQSRGWIHYAIHKPNRNILLFKRKKGYAGGAAKKPVSPPRKNAARGKTQ